MKKNIVLAIALLSTLLLSGCTTILEHSTDQAITPDPTRRTAGTWVDDERLEAIISNNIGKASDALDDSHINVNVFNGVVLLTGQVPNSEERGLAGDTARELLDVRQVHNELEIQNNTSFLARTNDNYLASKTKLSLYAEDEISGSRIEVICENSVIYLMGLITREHGDIAAEKASTIGGVRRVVKVFEYID